MTLKVYGRPNSINVQKAMWCIGELGLEAERLDIGGAFGGNDQDWYLALNPNGKIPVLDDNGVIIWESHSIVRYLAARYGDGGIWPSDPAERALADRWMDWMLGTLTPEFTPLFWQLIRTPEDEQSQEIIDKQAESVADLFGLVDNHLADREFIAGGVLSIGDFPIGAAAYRWYGLPVDHRDYRQLRRYYEGLKGRDVFRENVMIPIT